MISQKDVTMAERREKRNLMRIEGMERVNDKKYRVVKKIIDHKSV